MARKKLTTKQTWELMDIDDTRGEELDCAICGAEPAILRLNLNSAVNRRKFIISIGKGCALAIEAALRSFRKWSIRGGKPTASKPTDTSV